MVGARASCALEGEILASTVGEGSLSSGRARDPLLPAAAVLDRVRARVLRACMPWSGRIAADREARVAIVATATVLLSFALTLISPLMLLALGPIVLGVPHLVADVRYCVVRPGWHRDRGLWLAAVPVVAVGLGAPIAVGLAGVGVAIVTAHAATRRRLVGLALLGVLVVVAAGVGRWFDVGLTHLHNAIAVALWLAWRPRRRRWHLVPLALLVGCTAVLLAWPRVDGVLALDLGVPLRSHLAQLAPGVPTALALPLVVSFAFLQSVHYALWLRVVPEEDRERPTPRTFRASLAALDRDLGRLIVWLALAAALALALWAATDLFAARLGYLRFARFHAVLELCVLARLLVEQRTMTSRRDGGPDPGASRP
jgi:hypothetical protein